jgi:4-nitrophenyl phosphatase
MDREITYAKLRTATLAIRAGAHFVATNPDRTLPTEAGEVPGAGSLIAALIAATDRTPVMIGKPEPPLLEFALARLGQPRACTAALGDRIETDIVGATRLGLPAILVLSGVTREPPAPESELRPTWVFSSVLELHRAWEHSVATQE